MIMDMCLDIITVNPLTDKTSIYTMAADVLAPCDAKSSATRVSTVQEKQILVFQEELFQLPFNTEKCLKIQIYIFVL